MKSEPVLHEPRLNYNQKFEPVHKLFDHYLYILLILSNGKKMGVNDIFKAITRIDRPNFSHKTYTTDAIRNLKEGYLVEQSKEVYSKRKKFKQRRRTQKFVTQLTECGEELSNLIQALAYYEASFSKLRKSVDRYFNIGTNSENPLSVSQFNHRLKERGWKDDDIKNYSTWLEEVYQIQYLSPLVIIETLIARYFSIVYKFNVKGLAKGILTTLVIDTLRHYLLEGLPGDHQKGLIFNKILDQLTGRTITYFLNYTPPEQRNKFIQLESIEMVKALHRILNPSKDFLRWSFGIQSRDRKIKQQLDFLESVI